MTASDSENVCGRRAVSVYKYSRRLAGINNTPGDANDFCRSYGVRTHALESYACIFHSTFARMSYARKSNNKVMIPLNSCVSPLSVAIKKFEMLIHA